MTLIEKQNEPIETPKALIEQPSHKDIHALYDAYRRELGAAPGESLRSAACRRHSKRFPQRRALALDIRNAFRKAYGSEARVAALSDLLAPLGGDRID